MAFIAFCPALEKAGADALAASAAWFMPCCTPAFTPAMPLFMAPCMPCMPWLMAPVICWAPCLTPAAAPAMPLFTAPDICDMEDFMPEAIWLPALETLFAA
jgi:hypothetical protein